MKLVLDTVVHNIPPANIRQIQKYLNKINCMGSPLCQQFFLVAKGVSQYLSLFNNKNVYEIII